MACHDLGRSAPGTPCPAVKLAHYQTNAPPRHRGRLAFLATALALAGCLSGEAGSDAEPKPDEAAPPPSAAGVVRLSDEAVAKIGLEVRPVTRRTVGDSVPATGWLQAIPGREEIVKAPVAGYFLPRSEGGPARVGAAVSAGEDLGTIRMLVTPQEQAQLVLAKEEADTVIAQSQVSIDIAQAQLDRLRGDAAGVVAGTRLDQLRETIENAKAAAREARQKLPFLPAEPYDGSTGMKPVPIAAALAGRIVGVHAAPGQFVVQGDPLWTVADWGELWLRVPVFDRDSRRVVRDQAAQVETPGSLAPLAAEPVAVPHAVEPGTRTIDLFYRVPNPAGGLRPGEALSVALPVGGTAERAVVPRSAALYDGFGNAWVYVEQSPGTFRRTKIEPGPPAGDSLAVARGLEAGDRVVTTGAEALYAEEFRNQLGSGDDD